MAGAERGQLAVCPEPTGRGAVLPVDVGVEQDHQAAVLDLVAPGTRRLRARETGEPVAESALPERHRRPEGRQRRVAEGDRRRRPTPRARRSRRRRAIPASEGRGRARCVIRAPPTGRTRRRRTTRRRRRGTAAPWERPGGSGAGWRRRTPARGRARSDAAGTASKPSAPSTSTGTSTRPPPVTSACRAVPVQGVRTPVSDAASGPMRSRQAKASTVRPRLSRMSVTAPARSCQVVVSPRLPA